ncbi:MAG: hypothetical protein JSV59_13070 [Flavobacteriaceae bacterium]|nr:MAG: hypothetical protein JSV59_13070 [Flavobacteriaceae bacterium]
MIKFFRKIRQKLLSENKFSKYLLYAIGEIILVMVGILLALQVNNWNEERKDNKTRTEILTSLIGDLEEDRVSLKNHAKYDSLRTIAANLILDTLKGKPIEYSAKELTNLDIHFYYRKNVGQVLTGDWKHDFSHMLNLLIANDLSFQPRDMTYKALIQGDNATLIKDRTLENSISQYYNHVYYLNRGEDTMRDELSVEFKRQLMSDSRLTNDFDFFRKHKIKYESWIINSEINASWQKYSYQQLVILNSNLQELIKKSL